MKEFVFIVDQQFNNIKAIDFLKKQGVSDRIIRKVKFGCVYANGKVLQNINEKLFFLKMSQILT